MLRNACRWSAVSEWRSRVASCLLALAVFGPLSDALLAAEVPRRPNVVLILADDIGSPSSRSYRFIRKSREKKRNIRRSAALQIAANPGEFS